LQNPRSADFPILIDLRRVEKKPDGKWKVPFDTYNLRTSREWGSSDVMNAASSARLTRQKIRNQTR